MDMLMATCDILIKRNSGMCIPENAGSSVNRKSFIEAITHKFQCLFLEEKPVIVVLNNSSNMEEKLQQKVIWC